MIGRCRSFESSLCSEVRDGGYRWREGTQIDGESSNPPANTLLPLYDLTNLDVGSVMWNDEPGVSHCPEGCSSSILGHSKGDPPPPALSPHPPMPRSTATFIPRATLFISVYEYF